MKRTMYISDMLYRLDDIRLQKRQKKFLIESEIQSIIADYSFIPREKIIVKLELEEGQSHDLEKIKVEFLVFYGQHYKIAQLKAKMIVDEIVKYLKIEEDKKLAEAERIRIKMGQVKIDYAKLNEEWAKLDPYSELERTAEDEA